MASIGARTQGDAPMLTGRMMDFPLTLTHFLERARTYFGHSELVSRQPDRSLQRSTYADFYRRARAYVARLATLPTEAVAYAKQLYQASASNSLETQMEQERQAISACGRTADFAEGIDAFLGKRQPRFIGR